MKIWGVGNLLFCLFASYSFAQSSTLNINSSEPQGEARTTLREILHDKKFDENLQITDPKLRAESGSLSRYSMKFNLTYEGPMLGDIEAKDRPNPDNGVAPTATSLNGSMGFRYRLSQKSAINVGTGVNARYPTEGFEQFDLRNLLVSYDIFSSTKAIQFRKVFGMSITTVPEFRQTGQIGSLSTGISMVHNIDDSRFAVGLDSYVAYFAFSRSYRPGPGRTVAKKKHFNGVLGDGNAAQYTLNFIPNLKYLVSDHFDIATSVMFCYWDPRAVNNYLDVRGKTISQKLSFDYAITRDIYIAPYIGFYPTGFAWNTTTINISSIFSLM